MIVAVRADGLAESVDIVSDPGHGFGAAARECALKQKFEPARNSDGNAVAGTTSAFNVLYTH
jgi:protein TonB